MKLDNLNAKQAAKFLLGQYLVRTIGKQQLIGKIVETEAYHQDDAASHSYKGVTKRNKVMFGPAGYAYVYFTYGMHHCINVVVGPEGRGEAVLIRALEPVMGLESIKRHRNMNNDTYQLTNGPAKLCYAFLIDASFNGHNLATKPLQLIDGEKVRLKDIINTTRVGISSATDEKLRYYINNNLYVSVTNN